MSTTTSINSANSKPNPLVITKPPEGKVVHTELGVTTQNNPHAFLRRFGPTIQERFNYRIIELVPIESVGLEWRTNGKTHTAFTQSGVWQGYKVLVSISGI